MSAVLLAVFESYEAADHVRVDLIQDGFPTDRVDVMCCSDLGRAGLSPTMLGDINVVLSHPGTR